jgi:hypothetical protein
MKHIWTPQEFLNEAIKRARHRPNGELFTMTHEELAQYQFRVDVTNLITSMNYIPFRTVRFLCDHGKWSFIASARPGHELVDITPPPSIWTRIKRRFSGS